MLTAIRRIALRPRLALLALAIGATLAASCTLVGQGDLHVSNDLSGIGADNTTLRAYAPDSGDAFPPPGYLALFVKGDDFGRPPSYGMNGYLYLVSTNMACPQSEGAPEGFNLSDVTVVGIVTVTNGSVNQFLTMQDTPANRQANWALIEINEFAGYEPLHLAHRCGAVQWGVQSASASDPCTLRTSLEGNALAPGKTFSLDANTEWEFCYGGAAAGSNEKFLFRTGDGGVTWALISRTTLGNPPPEFGVGELPNGNGVSALWFTDSSNGWLGLTSPGHNFLRSTDGGHDWTEVVVTGLDPGVPVLTISFSDAMHGVFTTPTDTFTTSDGGATWTKS
jgi:hypothetical protein